MPAKPGTGDMRTLLRGIRRLQELEAIERAARELLDSAYERRLGPPLFDIDKINALRKALDRKTA